MKKRFLAIVLLLAITCALCIGASASGGTSSQPEYTHTTLTTAGGSIVSAVHYTTEIAPERRSELNLRYDRTGAKRISSPTNAYNCHSYAWHWMSTDNVYWIPIITSYLNDPNCTEIHSESQLQRFDIVVYYTTNNMPIHSGVIYSFKSDGTPIIRSKWAEGGLYEHTLEQIHSDFISYSSNGEPNVRYFRYHDFGNSYTGNNYHYDNKHFFEYISKCSVCGLTQGNTFWTSGPCAGPPCNTPFSIPSEDAAA